MSGTFPSLCPSVCLRPARSFSGREGTSGSEFFTFTACTPTLAGWCWTLQDIKTSLKTRRSWYALPDVALVVPLGLCGDR